MGGEAEGGLLEALRTSLQCSQLAADTAFNQIKALTGMPPFMYPLQGTCCV